MKKLLLLLLLALLPCVCSNMLGSKYNVSYLDMRSGLPHNFVNSIYKDSHGFIWVATSGGGLTRYDGYSFSTSMIGHDSMMLQSNSCRNMVEDKFRRLWVSFDEGTEVFDIRTYRKVSLTCKGRNISDILSESGVRVCRDSRDNIWLVSTTHVYRMTFDENGNIRTVASLPITNNTPDIAICDVDEDGNVWISLRDGICKLAERDGKLQVTPIQALASLSGDYVTAMMRFNGDVWISTNMGLYRYSPSTQKIRHYVHSEEQRSLAHNYTTCLAVIKSEGKLLVGSLGGINVYNPDIDGFDHWKAVGSDVALSSDFVHCLYVGSGAIWIGTETDGIVKLTSPQLKMTNYFNGHVNGYAQRNCVNSVFVEPNGTLWVGLVDGGLNRKAKDSNVFTNYSAANSGLSHNTVSSLLSDNRRRLWIGTWGGGVCWIDMDNPHDVNPLQVQPEMSHLINYIGGIIYDKHNDGIWIGGNDGLFFYNFNTNKLEIPFRESSAVRGCIGVLIDSKDRLWVGCQTGMRIIDLKSRKSPSGYFDFKEYLYKLDKPDSKIIDKITSFCQSHDGSIWIGSNGYGLYHATEDDKGNFNFESYTVQNGLANNGVKGVVEDMSGRLWITTNNGLSVLEPKSNAFTNYDTKDGLISSQFYWNSAMIDNNKVYLGTDKGLIVVDGRYTSSSNDTHLTFTALQVDNLDIFSTSRFLDEDISVAKTIYLEEGDKSFAIEFSALEFGSEAHGVYCYRMREFEKDWIQMRPGEHSVRYTNLPSGKYTFEVKYLSAMSDNSTNIASLSVVVNPYFWKTWWFMLIIFVLIVAVITYFYNRRIKKLKHEEVVKMLSPIREVLENSANPIDLQSRIRNILDNQEKFKESYTKSVEADQEREKEKIRPFMEILMKAMEDNYSNSEFDSEALADAVGLSRNLLVKKLKAETGQTVSQFIKEYRLNIAREILVKNAGNSNITEIAYRVGFNDPKYFTRCFTRQYGASPSNYLNMVEK